MSNRHHATVLFLSILVVGLAVFVRHNTFPFYYHPDESGKVTQVIRHKRNFNHPMMMLSTVDAARYVVLWGPAKKNPQSVGEVGRWATAAMSALTAAALALLAYRTFGGMAGWAVGILAITNPLLFELAHYFKEDPWLMAGIACVCLALNAYNEGPTTRRFYILAAACAMAAAGKYVGFVFVPLALWLVWRKTEPSLRKAGLLRFFGTFAGVWMLFNLPFLRSPGSMFESLHDETTKLAGMTDGVTRNVPHAFYIMTQTLYGGWTLPALSLIWVFAAVRSPRKITVAEWLLAVTALTQFILFSFIPKTAFRYHLPVSLGFAFLAVAGLSRLLASLRGRVVVQRVAFAASACLLGAAVFFQLQALWQLDRGFTSDDRSQLIAWIRTNLPIDAAIALDEAVNLPDLRRWEHAGLPPLSQRIIGGKKEAADLGTVSSLREQGVTHVAICERTYLRYLDANRSTKSGSAVTPEREFYDSLLKKGSILWSSDLGRVTYLQPGLKLIDISKL